MERQLSRHNRVNRQSLKDLKHSGLRGKNNNVVQSFAARPDRVFDVQIALIGLADWLLSRTHTYATTHGLLYFCMKHEDLKCFSISAAASKIFVCYVFFQTEYILDYTKRQYHEGHKILKLALQCISNP
jgi:hypothetical protein